MASAQRGPTERPRWALIQTAQRGSAGESDGGVQADALAAAAPQSGLAWLDIGCGRGTVLRAVRERHRPARLTGVDVIDWLDDDLRRDVELIVAAPEEALVELPAADRVLLIETIEHLDAPWSVLRAAARLVATGGRIVVSTPSVANLRHRLELPIRGELTYFRRDNVPHQTPALPHVIERILGEEGLTTIRSHAGTDIIRSRAAGDGPRASAAVRPRSPRSAWSSSASARADHRASESRSSRAAATRRSAKATVDKPCTDRRAACPMLAARAGSASNRRTAAASD